jgi:hypothetical protein
VTAGDVIGHERGVAADAADEVRTAVVLEALTEHIQARTGVRPRRWRISPERSSTGSRSHG